MDMSGIVTQTNAVSLCDSESNKKKAKKKKVANRYDTRLPARHQIPSLSINHEGWVVPSSFNLNVGCEGSKSLNNGDIEITETCRNLLSAIQMDLSSDIFKKEYITCDESKVPLTCPVQVGALCDESIHLEDLPYNPELSNHVIDVVGSIRRVGVALRKRQRRLKQQVLAQRLEALKPEEVHEAADESNKISAPTDMNGSNNRRIMIYLKDTLAKTFNTFRVLITLIRRMIDHPQAQDFRLIMKFGPKLGNDDQYQYYMFFPSCYCCVSEQIWNKVKKMLQQLMEELGLSFANISSRNNDGEYKFNVIEWSASLFNFDNYKNNEAFAKKCIGTLLTYTNVESRLHDVVMRHFHYGQDDEKQILLQYAIIGLKNKLTDAISRRIYGVRLTLYGSCLSGLTVGGDHDVDISVYIPELESWKQKLSEGEISWNSYTNKIKSLMHRITASLQQYEGGSFVRLSQVPMAKVPVIKGTDQYAKNPYSADGSLCFDLCLMNDIAVANSSLLREYSRLDGRVRVLLLLVKLFAKNNRISSAAERTLSSYTWSNLVVFYLQCIGFLPVLQCPKLMDQHNFILEEQDKQQYLIDGLNTVYLPSELILKENIWVQPFYFHYTMMPTLLYGFFNFYSYIFPQQTVAASIRFGTFILKKDSFITMELWRLCIEDPFETYDSRSPHDLGSHLNERTQKKIMIKLRRGAEVLKIVHAKKTKFETLAKSFFDLVGLYPSGYHWCSNRYSQGKIRS